jgi:hypothetical protein
MDENEIKTIPQSGPLSNILEKKWVSIIRLQKKVLELEQKVETMQEEMQNASKYRTSMKFNAN